MSFFDEDPVGCFDTYSLLKLSLEERNELFYISMARRGMKRKGFPELKAEDLIKKALDTYGEHLSVGWSGGKCSTVTLHLALQQDPHIKVHFNNTGIEYPEDVRYIRQLTKEWNINFTETKSGLSFWKDIVPKYGMPARRLPPEERAKLTIRERERYDEDWRPYCCKLLKEIPTYQYYKDHDVQSELYGLRAGESRLRAFMVIRYGLEYLRNKPFPFYLYMPIALWTSKDVDEYFQKNGIPHNHTYDTQKRNGCWCCTGFASWESSLLAYNPRLYKFVKAKVKAQDGYTDTWEDIL